MSDENDAPPQDEQHEQQRAAYNPFLKAGDVEPHGEEFAITQGFTRRKPGMYGEQIIMEITRARDSKVFDFGIGVGSVNHRVLARRMGNEQMWRGTLRLKREQGARSPFVAISEDPIPF